MQAQQLRDASQWGLRQRVSGQLGLLDGQATAPLLHLRALPAAVVEPVALADRLPGTPLHQAAARAGGRSSSACHASLAAWRTRDLHTSARELCTRAWVGHLAWGSCTPCMHACELLCLWKQHAWQAVAVKAAAKNSGAASLPSCLTKSCGAWCLPRLLGQAGQARTGWAAGLLGWGTAQQLDATGRQQGCQLSRLVAGGVTDAACA